jgi:hypothetical protein
METFEKRKHYFVYYLFLSLRLIVVAHDSSTIQQQQQRLNERNGFTVRKFALQHNAKLMSCELNKKKGDVLCEDKKKKLINNILYFLKKKININIFIHFRINFYNNDKRI